MKKNYLLLLFFAFFCLSAGAQGRMLEQRPEKPLSLKKTAAAMLRQIQKAEVPDTFCFNPQGERRNYDMSRIFVVNDEGNTAMDYGYFQTLCFGEHGDVYFNRLLPRVTFNPSLTQKSCFSFCINQLAICLCVTVYYKV